MFHQVFIYDPTEDEDPSRGLNLEQSKNESPHTVKEENPSESATMGFVQTEDLKIAVKELKSEQQSLISTQQVMKSDTETPQVNLETKNILNVTSCTNAVFPMNQTRQEFILPVADEQEIQPQPLTSSPAQFIIQEPQETTAVQSLGPSLISLLPQPALIGPMQLLSAPMTETGAGIAPATQVLDSAISQASTLKIDPSSCLSDVDMSEEQEGGSTVMINSEIKIENEELPVKSADLEDTQVKQDADKLQDLIECSSGIRLEVKQSGTNIEEGVPSITNNTYTYSISKVNLKLSNPESEKDCQNNITQINDSQLKLICDIKESTVPINHCISQKFTTETVLGSALKNQAVTNINEYGYISSSVGGQDYADDVSDCSDWEEEYLRKLNKNRRSCEIKIHKKTTCTTNYSIQPMKVKNEFCPSVNHLGSKFREGNNFPKSLRRPTDEVSSSANVELIGKCKSSNEMKRLKLRNNKSPVARKRRNNIKNSKNKNCTLNLIRAVTVQQIIGDQTVLCESKPINALNERGKPLCKTKSNPKYRGISPHSDPTSNKYQTAYENHSSKLRAALFGSQSCSEEDEVSLSPNNYNKGTICQNSSLTKDQNLPQVPYHCDKCDKYFETIKQFKTHTNRTLCWGFRREKRHQCDICGKLYKTRRTLEAHENAHINARPFKCFVCDKSFYSEAIRQIHYKNMHLNKKNRYLCCFCGYVTPNLEHIQAHEEEHRTPKGSKVPKPFKCLICGKEFISRFKQQKHITEHMLKKCGQCSDTFKTRTDLNKHKEAVHNIIKTYDCKQCGMQFKSSTPLKGHLKTHSSVLEYFCDVCDKGFKRKTNLQQHMITHSDDRPISCPECGDKFKRITHLKQHTAALHGDGRK